jgi:hypothetical protein
MQQPTSSPGAGTCRGIRSTWLPPPRALPSGQLVQHGPAVHERPATGRRAGMAKRPLFDVLAAMLRRRAPGVCYGGRGTSATVAAPPYRLSAHMVMSTKKHVSKAIIMPTTILPREADGLRLYNGGGRGRGNNQVEEGEPRKPPNPPLNKFRIWIFLNMDKFRMWTKIQSVNKFWIWNNSNINKKWETGSFAWISNEIGRLCQATNL